jgi:hypothetical protein
VRAKIRVDARRAGTIKVLRELAAEIPNVRLLDPIDLFCTAALCTPNGGRTLFHHDSAHLSPAGTERLYQHFRAEFEWAFGAPDRVSAQRGGDPRPDQPLPIERKFGGGLWRALPS